MSPDRTSGQSQDLLIASKGISATRKEVSETIQARSHELLVRGGFIHQEAAGIYTLLPLGLRVVRNIERVVRNEMEGLGAQEVSMPVLHPRSYWETTDRWDKFDVLFKVKSSTGSNEYALGATAEEMATPVAKDLIHSYRDLPLLIYQIQDKFRDEPRARSGILRGREFAMKDLYSFHENEEDLVDFYRQVKAAYYRIFNKVEVPVRATEASGATFTAGQTEEFMVLSELGEDTIVTCNSCGFTQNAEVATHSSGDSCPSCSSSGLIETSSIECGHIFNLGDKFPRDFDLKFTDRTGIQRFPVMGSYGIGITRLMGTIVEKNNDEKGIIWPRSVTPYDVHMVIINPDDPGLRDYAFDVARTINAGSLSVYLDDRRGVSAGVKLAEADLIGVSSQVIISPRLRNAGEIEVRDRKSREARVLNVSNGSNDLLSQLGLPPSDR